MSPFHPGAEVGFIGLGVMGSRMARWVLRKQWKLRVYSRREAAARPLVMEGATRATSPAELAADCRLVLLCLPDEAAIESVLFEANGLMKGLAPGSVVVDTSTIAATSARSFARRLATSEVTFIDAPVSGGQQGAEAGTLACMAGGPIDVVDAVRDVLGAFSRSVTYVGSSGAGQAVKACNQVAAAGALLGVSDAIALAMSQGVDPSLMREVLLSGTARSFVLEKDGNRIIHSEFTPGFKAWLMRKDLRIALQTVDGMTQLRAAPVMERLLNQLCESGGGELDWAAAGAIRDGQPEGGWSL